MRWARRSTNWKNNMGVIARIACLRAMAHGLNESDLTANPVELFGSWFKFARTVRIYWPDSIALATANRHGRPSVRMVLLKKFDDRGFVFYTNYQSQKGRELDENPYASMVIYWNDLLRQVRMTGRVEKTSVEESTAYFHSRPRGSQIGAWASNQDAVVANREELMQKVEQYEKEFAGGEVPLPPYWGGYRLVPDEIEFWQARGFRLHDRFRYTRTNVVWSWARLSP
jgi:pyridoxamine 5'-phosphate oxidase